MDVRELCKCGYRLTLIASTFALAIPVLATDPAGKKSWSALMLSAKRNQSALPENTNWFRAIKVAEKFGEKDPRFHIALYNAAVAYSLYNPVWSESLFKRDIANLEQISIDFPDIVPDCFHLATLYIWLGDLSKPEPLLLRAISIRNQWKDMQSKDPFNAEIYSSLYMLYYLQDKNEKAEEAKAELHKSLAVWHTYKTRAECLSRLGSNFHQCVDMSKSLSIKQRNHFLNMSLEMTKESAAFYKAGKQYQYDYAHMILEMATINKKLGNLVQSEQLARESLRLAEDRFDLLNRVAFESVKLLMQILGPKRSGEAQKLLDGYLYRVKEANGSTSVEYADALNRSAIAWENAKCFDLAEKKRREARALIERMKSH